MFATILKRYVWVLNLILLAVLAYLLALSVNGKIQSKVTSQNAVASQKNFRLKIMKPGDLTRLYLYQAIK